MVKTAEQLKFEYRDYKEPIHKIHRLVKEGLLFPLVKGVYETDETANPFVLARTICQPSYISFETALSYYGLIPERVYSVISASLNKDREKTYDNTFAHFIYKSIPERVYPYGVKLVRLDERTSFQIATKEKALCDKLYKLPPLKNYYELADLLYNDLRIDEDGLLEFDLNDMKFYAINYRSTNVDMLYRYLRRIK